MTTAIRLSPLQASERARVARTLYKCACSVAHYANEYNEKFDELKPYAKRVGYSVEQINNAIVEANEFMASIGFGRTIPLVQIDFPSTIEYDLSGIDEIHDEMVDIPRE